ncbi:MAG TPA: TonB-dependent receptor [Rhizobacter sp.]|nr:TonB-dependent receptor [Rhizobacter sp.]
MKTFHITATAAAVLASTVVPAAAWACSSCGCTLNSDWGSQGLKTSQGLSFDLRYDDFTQNDLRTGTGRVDRGAIVLPADREIQQKTVNRNTTLTVDYGLNADWGVSLQLPYLNRYHTTLAEGDTDVSESRSSSIGDVRVLGRYQGFSPEHNWGVQLGLKLATGSTGVNFRGGPQAGAPLDRGLQPGTGSTDLLLGVYTFGPINQSFDYFGQALLQLPMTSKDEFKPGAGLNLTAGIRYVTGGPVVPHLQMNLRSERKESGANADIPNSGATLAYLSPGVTWTLTEKIKAYGFVQVPFYQRVTGDQIEPKYSVSVGMHYAY